MRKFILAIGSITLVISLIFSLRSTALVDKKGQNVSSLAYYTSHLSELNKVTPQPFHMSQAVALLCVQTPVSAPSPHFNKFFDVYISPLEAPAIKTGLGSYPQGCVILKRKYSDPGGKITELYTGMIKRPSGYNPSVGDWEFFVISGDGRQVQESGKLQSCMQCHQAYSNSDFVTREYFKHPAAFTTGPVNW